MSIKKIIEAKSELTHSKKLPEPIVLSSRVRLARNLEDYSFPGWAKVEKKIEVFELCKDAILSIPAMRGAAVLKCDELSETERQVLVERHLISPELSKEGRGSGVIVSKNQAICIMINEEDHLRIQAVKNGFHFNSIWKVINELDSRLEKQLNFAFTPELGYLTACPTNIGTGLRASVMMHLPGLVILEEMEKVIRAVNQMGLAVRGIFGEGSDASGSLFQISNQQTLGEAEEGIMDRLKGVLKKIIEQEDNARQRLLEVEREKLYDKIGRAYGILRNGRCVSSTECMGLLSIMRLAVDTGVLPERLRRIVDRLFIDCQPGHIAVRAKKETTPEQRDVIRADILREEFGQHNELNFKDVSS